MDLRISHQGFGGGSVGGTSYKGTQENFIAECSTEPVVGGGLDSASALPIMYFVA